MSELFFRRQQTPGFKQVNITSAATTATIWAPSATRNLVVTDIYVYSGPGGQITFSFNNDDDGAEETVLVNNLSASSSAQLAHFTTLMNETLGGGLYAKVTSATSGGWEVTVAGFEVNNE